MAVPRLICPECETVLRPAKPLAAGKRVKCPKCGTTFAVREEDEDEAPPPAKRKKEPAAKKKPDDEPKKTGPDYEHSTYAVVREQEDEEVEEKEERGEELVEQFLKEKKSKDPRGPAQAAVIKPTNFLIITGSCGAGGWAILMLAVIILTLMPPPTIEQLDEGGKRAKMKGQAIGPGVAALAEPEDPAKKDKDQKAKDAEVSLWMLDLSKLAGSHWAILFGLCALCVLGAGYAGLIIYGAVKSQSLESRTWGIIASVLAMIPIGAVGFGIVTIDLASLALGWIYGADMIRIVLGVVEAAWGVSMGIMNIKTLMDPVVIKGFEYVPE